MNIKKYVLHFLNNFVFTFLILLIYSNINNQLFIGENFNYILLFIALFSILMFLIKPKKNDNIRNLDQNIRLYFITFIYSILLVYLSTILFNHYFVITPSLFIYLLFLVLTLTSSNILISRALMIHLDIYLVGTEYKLTNNDLSVLRELKINCYIYDLADDFLKNNNPLQKKIIINNLSITHDLFVKKINLDNTNNEIFDINYFLNQYLRKINFNDESIENIPPYNNKILVLKKIIDISVIVIFIPILAVAIPVSFILVKYQSKGGCIFSQNRIGKNGCLFKIFKIRSMHELETTNSVSENSNQKRIFSYGKFLRKSRLDELPQFINVLKGDMHISGPRAEWDYFQEIYTKTIKNYSLRNLVSPGITGFAQVMFRYAHNEEDSREKLMFDLFYIKNWTLWLEIEIGVKTIQVMINKKGT